MPASTFGAERLDPSKATIIRLSGHRFAQLSRPLDRPLDRRMHAAMLATSASLLRWRDFSSTFSNEDVNPSGAIGSSGSNGSQLSSTAASVALAEDSHCSHVAPHIIKSPSVICAATAGDSISLVVAPGTHVAALKKLRQILESSVDGDNESEVIAVDDKEDVAVIRSKSHDSYSDGSSASPTRVLATGQSTTTESNSGARRKRLGRMEKSVAASKLAAFGLQLLSPQQTQSPSRLQTHLQVQPQTPDSSASASPAGSRHRRRASIGLASLGDPRDEYDSSGKDHKARHRLSSLDLTAEDLARVSVDEARAQLPFGGSIHKILSLVASFASVSFNRHIDDVLQDDEDEYYESTARGERPWHDRELDCDKPGRPNGSETAGPKIASDSHFKTSSEALRQFFRAQRPHFVAQILQFDSINEAVDNAIHHLAVVWREKSIQGVAHAEFGSEGIRGLNSQDMIDKLSAQRGIVFERDLSPEYRHGCIVKRQLVRIEAKNQQTGRSGTAWRSRMIVLALDTCEQPSVTRKLLFTKYEEDPSILKHQIEHDTEIVRHLVEPDSSTKVTTSKFVRALARGDVARVTDLVERVVDINEQDIDGNTALHHAAASLESGHDSDIMSPLLRQVEIDVNIKNNAGDTPLHLFCQHCRWYDCDAALSLFMMRGADVDAVNNSGDTLLHAAVRNSAVRVLLLQLLIELGVSVDAQNIAGETALHLATRLGRRHLVRTLLHAGALPSIRDGHQQTPLELATASGFIGVQALLTDALQIYAWLEAAGLTQYFSSFFDNRITPHAVSERSELRVLIMDLVIDPLLVGKLVESAPLFSRTFHTDSLPVSPNLATVKTETAFKPVGKRRLLPGIKVRPADTMPVTRSMPTANKTVSPFSNDQVPTIPDLSMSSVSDVELSDRNVNPEHIAPNHPWKSASEQLARSVISDTGKNWILDDEELECCEMIGSGAAGTVFRGVYHGQPVAVKMLNPDNTNTGDDFVQEIKILAAIEHPNLVGFLGAVLEPRLCMVMELCGRGSLYKAMQDTSFCMTWERVLRYSRDMIRGLNALHSATPPILHRDVKSLNLLLSDDDSVKVCDFGLARFQTDSCKETLARLRGTMCYVAPEVYKCEPFTCKSDIFAAGILLWEIVNRCITRNYQRPFGEYRNLRLGFQILVQSAKHGKRPSIPPSCPSFIASLISRAWDNDPNERPECSQFLDGLDDIAEEYAAEHKKWDACIVR